ncbi:MAG: T9SS type A sorting domain-containing protein [Cytophagaceae bacterium]
MTKNFYILFLFLIPVIGSAQINYGQHNLNLNPVQPDQSQIFNTPHATIAQGVVNFNVVKGTVNLGGNTGPFAYPSSTNMVMLPNAMVPVTSDFKDCMSQNGITTFGVVYNIIYAYTFNNSNFGLRFASSNSGTASAPPYPQHLISATANQIIRNNFSYITNNFIGFAFNGRTEFHGSNPFCKLINTTPDMVLGTGLYPFELTIQNNRHYGWIRITGPSFTKLLEIAYEETPNKPILAGKTVDDATHCEGLAALTPNSETGIICNSNATAPTTLSTTFNTNYFYEWRKDGVKIPGANSNSFSPTTAGVYDVIVTNFTSNCRDTSNSISLSVRSLSLSLGNDTTVCQGSSKVVKASVTGTGPYSFSWSSNISEINGGVMQQYNVTINSNSWIISHVTDNFGCAAMDSVFFLTLPSGPVNLTSSAPDLCPPDPSKSVNLSVSGGGTYVLYKDGIPKEQVTVSSSKNWVIKESGSYYVVRNNACGLGESEVVNIAACTEYSIIKGKVFNDLNNNGTQDSGENGIGSVVIKAGDLAGITDDQGNYSMYVKANTVYSPEAILSNAGQVLSYPQTTYTINTGSGVNTFDNINFGIHTPPIKDLQVSIVGGLIIPGFDTRYSIILTNIGTEALNGTLDFKYDNRLNLLSASDSYTQNLSTLTFTFSNLLPGTKKIIGISFNATTQFTLNEGVIAEALGSIEGTDINLNNNKFISRVVVVGSYDPNDKLVFPVGIHEENYIQTSEELTYTIRFQNTGTYYAFNVVVKDTIDKDLDLSSFKSLTTSHPCRISIDSSRVITWTFNNIMLPDSNRNEPESHGHIIFRIKQNAFNPINTKITNKAYIYFDFNEAIITNEVLNTVNDNIFVTSSLADKNDLVDVHPNPSNGIIRVISDEEIQNWRLFDAAGKQVMYFGNTLEADISSLKQGLYIIKIKISNGEIVKRLIKE